MNKIGFVILHYNCYEETKQCIQSVLDLEQQQKIEIVVIDNASGNDSYERLKKEFGMYKINFIHNDENLGFSKANNKAYDFLRKKGEIKFVVFTNNDIFFAQRDFVKRVEDEYEKNRFAILGPDIYHPQKQIHQSPISKKMYRKKSSVWITIILNKIALNFFGLYYKLFIKDKPEVIAKVEDEDICYQENVIPSGACLICSTELFIEKEKIFMPETFFYYEEYILAWWCLKHKKKIVFNPDIQVYHNHGVATKSIGDRKQSIYFQMDNILKSAYIYLNVLKGKI